MLRLFSRSPLYLRFLSFRPLVPAKPPLFSTQFVQSPVPSLSIDTCLNNPIVLDHNSSWKYIFGTILAGSVFYKLYSQNLTHSIAPSKKHPPHENKRNEKSVPNTSIHPEPIPDFSNNLPTLPDEKDTMLHFPDYKTLIETADQSILNIIEQFRKSIDSHKDNPLKEKMFNDAALAEELLKKSSTDPKAGVELALKMFTGELLTIIPYYLILGKLEQSYRMGNNDALYVMPLVVSHLGVNEHDYKFASRLIEDIAKRTNNPDDPRVLLSLGYLYLTGKGKPRDVDKAKFLLKKAIELDPTDPLPLIHLAYHNAYEGANSMIQEEGFKTIEKYAFGHHNVFALWYYARFLQFGLEPFINASVKELFVVLRLCASQGNPKCMGLLAKLLINHSRLQTFQLIESKNFDADKIRLIRQSVQEALVNMNKSMFYGRDPEILFEIAKCYFEGFGFDKNIQSAREYAFAASQMGNEQAGSFLEKNFMKSVPTS